MYRIQFEFRQMVHRLFFASLLLCFCLGSSVSLHASPLVPNIPGLPGGAMLGSELAPVDVGRAVVVQGAAQAGNVYLMALNNFGQLMLRDSVAYTLPWAPPADCAGPRACFQSHTPSGKARTEWAAWRSVLSDERFDTAIQPQIIRLPSGKTAIVLSQTAPVRQIVLLMMSTSTPTTVERKIMITPVLPASPAKMDLATIGGRHNYLTSHLLVALTDATGAFRVFRGKASDVEPAFSEISIVPAGQPQITSAPLSVVAYGAGQSYGAILFKNGAEWQTRKFGINANSFGLEDLGAGRLAGLSAAEAPKIAWLPGSLIVGIYRDQNSRLNYSIGLHNAQDIGLPRGAVVHSQPVTHANIFTRDHDIFVAAVHTDRRLRLFRLNIETSRRFLQQVLEISLPADPRPGSLHPIHFGGESFLAFAGTNGVLYWFNAHRAATSTLVRNLNQYHYATPEMNGLQPYQLSGWSAFGTALTAMPWSHHALYTSQPAERCHPLGFAPPLACGQVFFEWNDYGGILPPAPGIWQTREWAIGTLEDSNPLNDWSPGTLRAYVGAVLLRSGILDISAIFHELAHEIDFDGINGTLVEGLDDLKPEWNAIFGDRTGAAYNRVRAPGFVTDYAEFNAAEDWADTARMYRWQGEIFRYLASFDKASGDNRLVAKYEFTKKVFNNVEYSNFGTPFYGDHFAPLHWLRHNVQDDNMLAASSLSTVDLQRQNYRIQDFGSEGWVVTRSLGDTTLPLKVLRNRSNGDFTVAATASSLSWLARLGYEETGQITGYVFKQPGPNRRRLNIYYSSERREAAAAASERTKELHGVPGRYSSRFEDAWVLAEPF